MSRTDEDRQEHVISLVGLINASLAGETIAEACTALTLAVACQIVATEKGGSKDRVAQARSFAAQLEAFVRRDDIVEWIKASTTYVGETPRNQ